jgi:hypothetical protein
MAPAGSPQVTYLRRLKRPRRPQEARYIWLIQMDGVTVASAGTKETAKRLAARLLAGRVGPDAGSPS